MVFESFGKVVHTHDEPGEYFYFTPACTRERKVGTGMQSMTLTGSSIPDRSGAPLAVSAVMNYQVLDAIAYAYSVDDPFAYIQNQGAEVLRRVCAKFPYLSKSEPSISKNSSFLGTCLRELTQQRVAICGVEITSMEIMEANYAPEVAQALLQVQ